MNKDLVQQIAQKDEIIKSCNALDVAVSSARQDLEKKLPFKL